MANTRTRIIRNYGLIEVKKNCREAWRDASWLDNAIRKPTVRGMRDLEWVRAVVSLSGHSAKDVEQLEEGITSRVAGQVRTGLVLVSARPAREGIVARKALYTRRHKSHLTPQPAAHRQKSIWT